MILLTCKEGWEMWSSDLPWVDVMGKKDRTDIDGHPVTLGYTKLLDSVLEQDGRSLGIQMTI